jgi:hypothetical protein
MWLQSKIRKENRDKMWLSKWVSQGSCGLPIIDKWLGECVAKPLPTRGSNSPPLAHRVRKLYGITWNRNTISLFSTCDFIVAHFGWGLSRDEGASANHKLLNQKFANRHQLFMCYDLAQQRRLPICANLWIPFILASLLFKPETLCCPQQNGFGP